MQVRLRATKRIWQMGETPTLSADVRNQGTRDLQVWRTQVTQCALEVGGRWYRWTGEVHANNSWFPPGREYGDIPSELVDTWHTTEGDEPLRLTPGRHARPLTLNIRWPSGTAQTVTAKPDRCIVVACPRAAARS